MGVKKGAGGRTCSQTVRKDVFRQNKGATIFVVTPFFVCGSGDRI